MSRFLKNVKIAVIGLGYVGLPLAVALNRKFDVVGFDINKKRIDELERKIDATGEVTIHELVSSKRLTFSSSLSAIKDSNTYIITVPTPVDKHKKPDLSPLVNASEMIGKIMSKNDIVIYESTVFPGATEEICVPILERVSKLKFNQDFFVGYSPERVNPGDKKRRVGDIVKVTSGSNGATTDFIDELYASCITAGTYKVYSIRVAEAAKVIENTQRDVNIALVNELAIIFNKLGIDTLDVLEAAGTKWNFLPFRPGLVGGHCIGVDPYYLTYKAQSVGYQPEMIVAGRRINDNMGHYVVSQLIKEMIKKRIQVDGAKVLVMGLTFKENCPDLRNTKVTDIIDELKEYDIEIDVMDNLCAALEAKEFYNIDLVSEAKKEYYDAIIIAVGHDEFREIGKEVIRGFGHSKCIIYDLKYVLDKADADIRL